MLVFLIKLYNMGTTWPSTIFPLGTHWTNRLTVMEWDTLYFLSRHTTRESPLPARPIHQYEMEPSRLGGYLALRSISRPRMGAAEPIFHILNFWNSRKVAYLLNIKFIFCSRSRSSVVVWPIKINILWDLTYTLKNQILPYTRNYVTEL